MIDDNKKSAVVYHFEALYFADRLHVVNPYGDVGVLTLWTPVRTVRDYLERAVDLNSSVTRIAVLGNLYGDGLPQLVRNLLWNPQIRYLLILGQNLSDSAKEVMNLLTTGVELTERLGQMRFRIKNTSRYLDVDFDPELLTGWVKPVVLNKLSLSETMTGVYNFFTNLPPKLECVQRERKHFPLPNYQPVYYPSNPHAHTIVSHYPLEAWLEVVFQVLRFGIPTTLAAEKRRIELYNLKVVITEPAEDSDSDLQSVGYTLESLHAYQREILCSVDRQHETDYSYGERLRKYWLRREQSKMAVCSVTSLPRQQPIDMLEVAASELARNQNSRKVLLSLWDPSRDLGTGFDVPCLTTLFFRVLQGALTVTATFRAHNVMSAWLRNLYGIMAIQKEVAFRAGDLPLGPIIVISQSISIDLDAPERLDLAQQIAAARKNHSSFLDKNKKGSTAEKSFQMDPNGYFTFTIDQVTKEIVAVQKSLGETLNYYRGRTAIAIEKQIIRDKAISDVGHALYVGRQLTLLETQVRKNKDLEERSSPIK